MRQRHRRARAGAFAFGLSLIATTALAQGVPSAEYDPDLSPATDQAYEWARVPGDPKASPEIKADLDYVRHMRSHHAGALTMSQEYLADPEARNPVLRRLARAIIPNQKFEIDEMDEVQRQVERPPALAFGSLVLRPAAMENLAQRWRFARASIPTPIDVAIAGGPVSERDVQFAKGMTIHHRAALDMARDYNASPHGRNTWLRRLNHDIIVDQQQEIWTMNAVIARYPGDPSKITVDPSMIHGMEGMAGHGQHDQPAAASSGDHDGHQGHGAHDGHDRGAQTQSQRPAAERPAPATAKPPRRQPAKSRPAPKSSAEDHHRHH